MISASVLLVGLFQNCSQKGELSLTSDLAVEAQTMTNTFYILKNSDKATLKPILSNQEAVALSLQTINNSSVTVVSAPESSDPVKDLNQVVEFFGTAPLPLETQHGTLYSIDQETGRFEYAPRRDSLGEDIFNIIKRTRLEVNSALKDAVKAEDGKYYLETKSQIAVKIVIHDHLISEVNKSDSTEITVVSDGSLNPIERDKFSPEKPNLFDDGSFPDEVSKTPKFSWEHSFDKDSGINYYEVAIGTTAGGTDVKTWTNVGFVNSVVLAGPFKEDQNYFASIRAVDFAGLRSEIAQGDGWLATQFTTDSLVAKITAPSSTSAAKIEFKIQFTQIVPKLLLNQLSLTNIKGNPILTGSGRNYALNVEGNPEGSIFIKIQSGAITDVFGNKNKVDFTATVLRPKTPTLVALGIVPNNLTESPKVNWPDAGNSDAGWASYTANIYEGSQKIKSQPKFLKGNAINELKLIKGHTYTVKVQGVDTFGNLGLESLPVDWTANTKAEFMLVSGSGVGMDVVSNSLPENFGIWVEFVFQNKGGEATPGQLIVEVSNKTNYEIWTDRNKTPTSAVYKACQAASISPQESCSVFIRSKSKLSGTFIASNLLMTGMVEGLNPAPIPLFGKASGFPDPPLFDFVSHTFTNCGAKGNTGPTLQMCVTDYKDSSWAKNTSNLNMTTPGIQLWTVPKTGMYTILAKGAQGGSPGNGQIGGYGAAIQGDFNLKRGEVIRILVGQSGYNRSGDDSSGGGGTFVVKSDNTILVVAGGGGGAGQSSCELQIPSLTTKANDGCPEPERFGKCDTGKGGTGGAGGTVGNCEYHASAGGGFSGNGANGTTKYGSYGSSGGTAFLNGGTGGGSELPGGFGGGGGSHSSGGKGSGGGGYSGGGGGPGWSSGGGGSSLNNGINQDNTAASNKDMGSVFIKAL
jgi:hypothetical protein